MAQLTRNPVPPSGRSPDVDPTAPAGTPMAYFGLAIGVMLIVAACAILLVLWDANFLDLRGKIGR